MEDGFWVVLELLRQLAFCQTGLLTSRWLFLLQKHKVFASLMPYRDFICFLLADDMAQFFWHVIAPPHLRDTLALAGIGKSLVIAGREDQLPCPCTEIYWQAVQNAPTFRSPHCASGNDS